MAWTNGRYYSRSLWKNGQVVRQYVGCGRKADEAARIDAQTRAEMKRLRRIAADIEQEERDRIKAIEEPLRELEGVCNLLMRTALVGAGFHQHNRGPWRKRQKPPSPHGCSSNPPASPPDDPLSRFQSDYKLVPAPVQSSRLGQSISRHPGCGNGYRGVYPGKIGRAISALAEQSSQLQLPGVGRRGPLDRSWTESGPKSNVLYQQYS